MAGRPDVLVIGAGVIGLTVAHAALGRGLSVAVLDREGPAAGASAGNAGGFAFCEIHPLASIKTLLNSPRWLLDPLGPLSIPPAYALRIAPWMARFARASLPDRVAKGMNAQAALMRLSKEQLEPLMTATGTLPMLRKRGQLQVYETETAYRQGLHEKDEAAGFGYRYDSLMGPAAIAEVQPGLSPRFAFATHTPDWWSIADPRLYVRALADAFLAKGGVLETGEALAIESGGPVARVRLAGGQQREAGHVVVAAGARSHRLARTLGDRIPLETERGYNTTLPPEAFDLNCHITFAEHGFVAGPLATGVRIGGAVELGGLDLPPNFARSRAMLAKAATFLPGLRTEGGTEWMGFRPSLPDSLPVIGAAPAAARVIYAFGHGHLGLTQSSGTAAIVAGLLTGGAPPISLSAFAPGRFGRLV